MSATIKTFDYHIAWRARSRRPGAHSSTQRGMGMEFRGHTTLLSYPDPRRIDIRQTIRDPLEQVHVRIFNQKSAAPVVMLCDLSGSMAFGRQQRKISIAADILQSIAKSATDNADSFAFIGYDDVAREDWRCAASFRPHQANALADRLRHYQPDGSGSGGLMDAIRHLPRERALVFLVSDFHLPLAELEPALALLLRHHVVPLVLWDEGEYKALPNFGIVTVTDPESGARRTLLLRKAYRERIIQHFAARRQALEALLLRCDMPPLWLEQGYDADVLTDYFYRYMAA